MTVRALPIAEGKMSLIKRHAQADVRYASIQTRRSRVGSSFKMKPLSRLIHSRVMSPLRQTFMASQVHLTVLSPIRLSLVPSRMQLTPCWMNFSTLTMLRWTYRLENRPYLKAITKHRQEMRLQNYPHSSNVLIIPRRISSTLFHIPQVWLRNIQIPVFCRRIPLAPTQSHTDAFGPTSNLKMKKTRRTKQQLGYMELRIYHPTRSH